MQRTHKIMNRPHYFHVYTACRRVIDTWEAKASENWKWVTCKRCLAKQNKLKEK